MKKIKISLKSKDYNITLEDEFAPFFESELKRVFKDKQLFGAEDFLKAFVQLTYEKFKNEELQKNLIKNIENGIS